MSVARLNFRLLFRSCVGSYLVQCRDLVFLGGRRRDYLLIKKCVHGINNMYVTDFFFSLSVCNRKNGDCVK